jgi:pseudaminic acid cytidylyltransferase|tara:strand:+ start:9046 stop:9732 length:687 start_codon:yes stop_codon:yes gene_type:complete
MKTKTICLIPARGGSKRIKNKNIKNFFGKPLLERVIENSKKSKLFDDIYVSTDSVLIKRLAIRCGAIVPYIRSKKLSNDHAIIKSVIDDFISKVILDIKQKINIFVLYPTSVFVDKKLIIKCNQILKTTEYVTTVKKFPHPIQRALKFNKNKLEPLNLKKKLMRTQDLEDYYYNSGQIDCFKLDAWVKKRMFHKMNAKFIILKDLDSVDIDTPEDLRLAHKVFKLNKK